MRRFIDRLADVRQRSCYRGKRYLGVYLCLPVVTLASPQMG